MRVWLHGAFASPASFNYFRTKITGSDDLLVQYDYNGDLIATIYRIKDFIESQTKEPVDLIGHSLGGVIARILEYIGLKVRSLVTLSAPFGGLENAFLLKLMFPNSVYANAATLKATYGHLAKGPPPVPHLCFVTTTGQNPMFLGKANDGVVSVESQTAIYNANYLIIETNHYEILMNDDVVDAIQRLHRSVDNGQPYNLYTSNT